MYPYVCITAHVQSYIVHVSVCVTHCVAQYLDVNLCVAALGRPRLPLCYVPAVSLLFGQLPVTANVSLHIPMLTRALCVWPLVTHADLWGAITLRLLESEYRTADPDEADFYWIPGPFRLSQAVDKLR
jgi:hypothetical protein